jgi:hypothetical protein
MAISPEMASLLVMCGIALFILWRWHTSAATDFDLRWGIVDTTTGKFSLYKFCQLGAFILSSWLLVHETRAGRLNEVLYTTYMLAWTGVNIANKIVDAKKAATP